jgi:flagellar basal-body rod protein FlgG
VSFADLVANGGRDAVGALVTRVRADLAQGKVSNTGNPLDLAIGSDGFFQLRNGDDLFYSRQGQFKLAADGTVVTPQGYALQQAGGGDLVLDGAGVNILADGTVLDGERPVGRIGVFSPSAGAAVQPLDGSLLRFAGNVGEEVAEPHLRQGMIEASNVSVGDEMVTMMASLRQAETGARLVQTYDDLLGRAITAFGQGGR